MATKWASLFLRSCRIPYVYVAEISGYELDPQRTRKSPRLPNPAVPFSYLSYSSSQETPVVPVFVASPGSDQESLQKYADVFADSELIGFVRAVLFGESLSNLVKVLNNRVVALIALRASSCRQDRSLTPQEWAAAYQAVDEKRGLIEFLLKAKPLTWSKTAYIQSLTASARQLMEAASRFGVGLTSCDLPLCVISADKRAEFAGELKKLYKRLPRDFAAWMAHPVPLTICWVMGFKPRGDDARPDRGLPPLARMLIGKGEELLTVVYGPASAATWPLLESDPAALARQNGLWEAIFAVSDGLLIDSATDRATNHGYLREHWASATPSSTDAPVLVPAVPAHIGENDVDTVLHTVLSRLGTANVFEGRCNPPGGDWSGISLQGIRRDGELRWLSLPRVSKTHAKRPDHVFQIFALDGPPVILAVESKERFGDVETRIGPRLKAYISDLLASSASVERRSPQEGWRHSETRLDIHDFALVSAVAFLARNESDIEVVRRKSRVDLILAFNFAADGAQCDIRCVPCTKLGNTVAEYLCTLPTGHSGISVRRDQ